MRLPNNLKEVLKELKEHVPFTILGAATGVIFMLIFRNLSKSSSHTLFSVFHPGHVLLSAMVTAAMFKTHRKHTKFWIVLLVGYFGSIGIATLSDSIMPYIGEEWLGLHISAHTHEHDGHVCKSEHNDKIVSKHDDKHSGGHLSKIHFGFIEEWYIVNPAAVIGIIIAWWLPKTKTPHAGHVLISTWASSSHVLMTAQSEITVTVAMSMLAILFLATWLPCCISDIVFPVLLTGQPDHHKCCM